jgi:hypothetical protein
MKTLLIVETIPDRRASEGKALKEALEIMKKSWDGRTVRHLRIDMKKAYTKKELRSLLQKDSDHLHISAHGSTSKRDKRNRHVLLIGRKIRVKPDDIRKWKPKARNIFVSACNTGYEDLASAFFDFDSTKKGRFMAPLKEPYFDEAFLTAVQFHRGAFLEGSYRKAERHLEELGSVRKTYCYFKFPK